VTVPHVIGAAGPTLLVGLSLLASGGARAGHNTATSNTIQLAATQRLAFGRLLDDLPTGGSETVAFTASGQTLVEGTHVLSVGGTVQPAGFTLSASDLAMTGQTVTVSATALSGTASGPPLLAWRWLKAEYDGSQTAQTSQTTGDHLLITLTGVSIDTVGQTLRVFGSIEVESGDAVGSYSGVITVTANHQ
jgi:hypothetical protein